MRAPTQTYRCSFSTLFLWIVLALLLLDVFKMIFLERIPFPEIEVMHNFNTIVLIAMVSSVILVLTLKSTISVEGLSSYNCWGASDFIRWEKISNVCVRNLLGLGYYRIVGEDGKCVYVARYLSRQSEFEMIVSAITPKSNPLRLAIEGREKEGT